MVAISKASSALRPLGSFTAGSFKATNQFEAVERDLGLQDRIALLASSALGTMYAVYVLTVSTTGWILFQVAVGGQAFDPYPFAFLAFLGGLIQLLLMPLLLVGQNIQGRHAEARAEEEFQTVGRVFHDLSALLEHLDAQDRELVRQTRLLIALVEGLLPATNGDSTLAAMSESRIESGLDARP